MKAYLSIFFSLTLILISCKKNNDSNDTDLPISILDSLKGKNGLSYNESLSKWNHLKKINGNSYIYKVEHMFPDFSGKTTELKIVDGKVVERVYKEFDIDEKTLEQTITDSYTEDKETLGSHEEGASPLTIDELYSSCAGDYLTVDIHNNIIYFETEEINGLMTLCGFVPYGCADYCYQGISIESFNWID